MAGGTQHHHTREDIGQTDRTRQQGDYIHVERIKAGQIITKARKHKDRKEKTDKIQGENTFQNKTRKKI